MGPVSESLAGKASAKLATLSTGSHMTREPDIYFIPVPERVLTVMLEMAAVGRDDLVYDLGCGDGRVIIAAAHSRAARGVGVDLDPDHVEVSRANGRRAGLLDRVEFRQEDFFTTDLRPATVVALYLLDSLNVRLRPKILAECRPGTRVVSYSFEMGEWECDAHTPIAANGVRLWVVPANLSGRWVAGDGSRGPWREIVIEQQFQRLEGWASADDGPSPIREGRVGGEQFRFVVDAGPGPCVIAGRIDGDRLEASIHRESGDEPWNATRQSGTQRPLE